MTTDETKLLTKIGYLFLRHLGCYEIATELWVFHREYNWETTHQKDCHSIIDILGVQREYRYSSPAKVTRHYPSTVGSWDILRGIEVKVSRSDLAKGFIQSGCTYHYLLMPKGLVEPSKVSRGIGIVEVDAPNFKVFTDDYQYLTGVTITRNAKRKEAQQTTIDRCKEQIAGRLTTQVTQWIQCELTGKEKAQV